MLVFDRTLYRYRFRTMYKTNTKTGPDKIKLFFFFSVLNLYCLSSLVKCISSHISSVSFESSLFNFLHGIV